MADLRTGPQLLTYPDSLGGHLADIADLLAGPLDGLFSGVHVLPPFPSSGDRGFAPTTYLEIEPRFGSWPDIEQLAVRHDVVLDVMVNHLSRRSREFQDFERRGRGSPAADLFLMLDKVWPSGDPPGHDVARIFLRRPVPPFSTVRIADTGVEERVWTTFGRGDASEQVDLDVRSAATRDLIGGWLRTMAGHGVRVVRLDAVGYVIKEPGTSCFMVEPGIWAFLAWITSVAEALGLTVLPEVHAQPPIRDRLASRGFWTYDFILPGLLLHALTVGAGDASRAAARLARHLAASARRQFTMLDCHDGIPVRPDLDGILDADAMRALSHAVLERGGNASRLLTIPRDDAGVDVHQLNATYFSALGEDADRYVLARAIQLFARGIPQIYYVGLLAGSNDPAAVAATGDGRGINRHDYTRDEVNDQLRRPVVRRILELVRLRRTHPAFEGVLDVVAEGSRVRMTWRHDQHACSLDGDLESGAMTIEATDRR